MSDEIKALLSTINKLLEQNAQLIKQNEEFRKLLLEGSERTSSPSTKVLETRKTPLLDKEIYQELKKHHLGEVALFAINRDAIPRTGHRGKF